MLLDWLQRVMNAAAEMLYGAAKYSDVSVSVSIGCQFLSAFASSCA